MLDKARTTIETGGLKVIGAGFGRTGTLSLKAALEELGFGPCYHMIELFHRPQDVAVWEAAAKGEPIDWSRLFAGYQATVDWPSCAFYEELMKAYPDARIILTVRDPESWYESAKNTISRKPSRISFLAARSFMTKAFSSLERSRRRVIKAIVWQGTFDDKFDDRQHAITIFKQHNEDVKQRVPPEKLLVYEVKEGWEPLCAFLGVEVPRDKPFPHLNTRDDFIGNRRQEQLQKRVTGGALLVGSALVALFFLGLLLKRAAPQRLRK